MRIPSLTSLSPKSVYTRFGNRRRSESTSSASTTASSASANGSKPTLQGRPYGLSLYELLYSGSGGRTRRITLSSVGYWSDEVDRRREEGEEEEEGLSVLEPRPRHCIGLFEVLEL